MILNDFNQNWKEMTHDWMDGVVKFLLSAPVRLLFWSLFGEICSLSHSSVSADLAFAHFLPIMPHSHRWHCRGHIHQVHSWRRDRSGLCCSLWWCSGRSVSLLVCHSHGGPLTSVVSADAMYWIMPFQHCGGQYLMAKHSTEENNHSSLSYILNMY